MIRKFFLKLYNIHKSDKEISFKEYNLHKNNINNNKIALFIKITRYKG